MKKRRSLFEPVAVPNSRCRNRIHEAASWWTWSEDFRECLPTWLHEAQGAGYRPRTARIPGLKRYDYTFSALHCESGKALSDRLAPWAENLRGVKSGTRIMLLRELLLPGMTSDDLRLLFTALRDALSPDITSPDGALYAPLGDTGGAPSEFPLHCDLYVPRRLWNVFDEVPSTGNSGASVFLRTADLARLALECGIPKRTRDALKSCLTSEGRDRYDEFYSLLYASTPESDELDRRMRAAAYRIRLKRGEGYLIDDRVWMHGRTMTERSVTRNRLHRLTF